MCFPQQQKKISKLDPLVQAQAEAPNVAHPRAAHQVSNEFVETAQTEHDAGPELDGIAPPSVLVEKFQRNAPDRLELPQRHLPDHTIHVAHQDRPRRRIALEFIQPNNAALATRPNALITAGMLPVFCRNTFPA